MVDGGVGDGDIDVARGWCGGGRNFADLEITGFGGADGFHFAVDLLVRFNVKKRFHKGVIGKRVKIEG